MASTFFKPNLAYGLLRHCGKSLLLILILISSAAAAEPLRLVALGDSLTAGYGLPEEEGFAPQLDDWLAENGRPEVEVVNMGVSGDTSAGGLARVDWALGGGADAVLLELGANDMLRGVDPASTRENLDQLIAKLTARDLPVLISGMLASRNFGPDYKEEFDAIFPDLAEKHGILYDPFFLEGLVGRGDLFQPDGLHPTSEGVALIVARIGPRVLELLDQVEP
ncbi:arylesterase [Rhodobacteraceae bacterium NNCM2]|nr:arylesterase [Coraliihabitans acroporae]